MSKTIGLILSMLFSITNIFAQSYTSLVKVKKEEKYGYLNEESKEVIPCEFDLIDDFSEGVVAALKGGNWEYYNTAGERVLDLGNRYTFCGKFKDGVAFVTELPVKCDTNNYFWTIPNEEIQFIDKKGKSIFKIKNELGIAFKMPHQLQFSDGLMAIEKTYIKDSYVTHFGYMNKSGDLVLPFEFRRQFKEVENFSEDLAGISIYNFNDYETPEIPEKFGYINKKGTWVIPPRYKAAFPFKYGAALVQDGNPKLKFPRYFLINKQGEPIFSELEETAPKYQKDSLLAVYKGGRDENGNRDFSALVVALAKTDGTMITNYVFGHLRPGKAPNDLWSARKVKADGRLTELGFVDDKGELVIPYQYKDTKKGFENGLAIVQVEIDGRWQHAIINTKNELIRPPDPKAKYYLRGGVILHYEGQAPDDAYDWNYYNKKGESIDFSGYEISGHFQYLKLPD